MDDLRTDPEYEVRWPVDVFTTELDKLITRGSTDGVDDRWKEEVETLLQQAFTSGVPGRAFEQQWHLRYRAAPVEEEPF